MLVMSKEQVNGGTPRAIIDTVEDGTIRLRLENGDERVKKRGNAKGLNCLNSQAYG